MHRPAAIEPIISHLKNDHRMARCFLKGAQGAGLNLALAAAAWNIKKWINELTLALILWLEQSYSQRGPCYQLNFYAALGAA